MEEEFLQALEEWKEENLSPYCLNQCQRTCCDLSPAVYVKKRTLITLLGYEPEDLSKYSAHPLEDAFMLKGLCPQYDPETKRCQIRDRRPDFCRLYPFEIQFISDKIVNGWLILDKRCQFSHDEKEIDKLIKFSAGYGMVVLRTV